MKKNVILSDLSPVADSAAVAKGEAKDLRATCFLVNPRSGGGAGGLFVPALKELRADSMVRCIGDDADIPGLIQDPDISRIIVVGGDGTFSSLLAHAVGSEKVFGILPIGTGNDLAKELGVYNLLRPDNLAESIDRLMANQEKCLDVWRCDFADGSSRHFCNYLSIGFDAAVLEKFEALRMAAPAKSGLAALLRNRYLYLRAGLENLSYSLPEAVSVRSGGKEETAIFSSCKTLLFPNIRSYMGLAVSSRDASPFDGRISCLVQASIFSYAAALLRKWFPIEAACLGDAAVWRIDLEKEKIPLQCDGELATMSATGSMEISFAGKVKVLAN